MNILSYTILCDDEETSVTFFVVLILSSGLKKNVGTELGNEIESIYLCTYVDKIRSNVDNRMEKDAT